MLLHLVGYTPLEFARQMKLLQLGKAFLLTVGAFLLAVKLLCLKSLKALIGRTFLL